jgi:HD-GYP domain-containing protein (c-di-GMP phosphodiesterase class II)
MLNLQPVSLFNSLASIIKSIDLYNYILKDHHRRCSIIAYYIGNTYAEKSINLSELILAASLHDIGALNVKERDQLLKLDVEEPSHHEQLGAKILEGFEPFDQIRRIILHHHIRYIDVQQGLTKAEDVPFECYILHLADRIEIMTNGKNDVETINKLKLEINNRFGKVFHPDLQKVFNQIIDDRSFWININNQSYQELVHGSIKSKTHDLNYVDAENLALIFAKIVDYKSPWTSTHSQSVSAIAYRLGKFVGLDPDTCFQLRIAGYLHDIGKIATPTEILEKPSKLNGEEFDTIKEHAMYTSLILKDIEGFDDIATWASSHHEKHDHSGYPLHLSKDHFSLPMEVLAFADIFTALSEDRPYRPKMSKKDIKKVLSTFVPEKLDINVYEVLLAHFDELYELHLKIFNSIISSRTDFK